MLQGVWDSVFEGGVNSTTHRLMNLSFYGLFATLTVLALVTRGNVHVIALLVLSAGLFVSVNWCVPTAYRFISELHRARKED